MKLRVVMGALKVVKEYIISGLIVIVKVNKQQMQICNKKIDEKKNSLAKLNKGENECTSLKKNSICQKRQNCISQQTLEADKGKKEKKVVGERRKQKGRKER